MPGIRQLPGSRRQVIDPLGTRHIIVVVIVLPAVGGVDKSVRHACILQPVAGSLKEPWLAAQLPAVVTLSDRVSDGACWLPALSDHWLDITDDAGRRATLPMPPPKRTASTTAGEPSYARDSH